MKKKLIISILCVAVASIMLFAVGCASFPRVNVANPQTETDFLVQGNGSIAVQYGRYVYFVNGTRGTFEDANATDNRWGDVVQGGIYRATLKGNAVGTAGANTLRAWNSSDVSTWSASIDNENEQRFAFDMVAPLRDTQGELLSTWNADASEYANRAINRNDPTLRFGERLEIFENYEENYDIVERSELHERVDIVDVELIAPVTVGTSTRGGMWIFGNYIFFATPNNLRDRQGNVQDYRTTFIRMGLDGSNPRTIFTTDGEADNLPFVFHAVGDAVYLVSASTNENGLIDIVSVRTTSRRIYRPYLLTSYATNVLMPFRSTFDRYNRPVGLEDFIFFTRDASRLDHGDTHNTGNIIFVISPCGTESISLLETGDDSDIIQINDNKLFYIRELDGVEQVRFNNLYNMMVEASPRFAAYVYGNDNYAQVSGLVYGWGGLGNYSYVYFFSSVGDGVGPTNNAAYALTFGEEGVFVVSYIDRHFNLSSRLQVLDVDVEFLFVNGSYMYYILGEQLFRVNLFNAMFAPSLDSSPQLLSGDLTLIRSGGNANVALVAGHVAFFAQADRFTVSGGYTFFSYVERQMYEPFFVGVRDERDIPSDEVLLNYLRGIEGDYIDGEDGDGQYFA